MIAGFVALAVVGFHAMPVPARPPSPRATKLVASEAVDITDDGGVLKTVLKAGSGAVPTRGCTVEVHYDGTLAATGAVFDSSRKRGKTFKFDLGLRQVIAGWDLGLASMQVGELAKLTCKPQYAYGPDGSPPAIPPSATLDFEVELISFREPAEKVEACDPNTIDYDDLALMMDMDDDDW